MRAMDLQRMNLPHTLAQVVADIEIRVAFFLEAQRPEAHTEAC